MSEAHDDQDKFPYAGSRAALMLRNGLDNAHRESGLSIRSLGKQLGYKQATVLSHMASGRVAIPLERAPEIARAVGLPPASFLTACVEQKSSEAADLLRSRPFDDVSNTFSLMSELSVIAGEQLDDLNDEQKSVMRKVVADPRPARRWLSEAELPTVEGIRRLRPTMPLDGLSASDRAKVEAALRE